MHVYIDLNCEEWKDIDRFELQNKNKKNKTVHVDGQNGKVKKTNFRIINSVERTWNQLDLFIRELKWVNFRYTLTFNNGGLLFQLKFFFNLWNKNGKNYDSNK